MTLCLGLQMGVEVFPFFSLSLVAHKVTHVQFEFFGCFITRHLIGCLPENIVT